MVDFVSVVEGLIRSGRYPALIFLFSRKMVEEQAVAIARRMDLLEDGAKQKVREYVSGKLPAQARSLHPELAGCLERGVGFHHAGLLPSAKRVVEELFVAGYLPIVVCTETFALGVNYPARAVVIGQVTKRDDGGYRPLTNREYLQMGGRAGRRGQDRVGYVYICVDPDYPEEVPTAVPSHPEEVAPGGEFTCEGVLRLVDALGGDPEILRQYVTKSFAAYWREIEKARIVEELKKTEALWGRYRGEKCRDEETCPFSVSRQKEVNAIKGAIKSCVDSMRDLEALLAQRKLSAAKKARYLRSMAKVSGRKAVLEGQLRAIIESVDCPNADKKNGGCLLQSRLRDLEARVARLRQEYAVLSRDAIWQRFEDLAVSLTECGFLAERWELTPKGRLALDAGPGGVMLAEIVMRLVAGGGVEPLELARHAGGCAYEGDTGRGFLRDIPAEAYELLVEEYDLPGCSYDPGIAAAVRLWAGGSSLVKAVGLIGIAPGDFVVCVRRAAEALRGLAVTKVSAEIRESARRAYEMVWRDEVADVL